MNAVEETPPMVVVACRLSSGGCTSVLTPAPELGGGWARVCLPEECIGVSVENPTGLPLVAQLGDIDGAPVLMLRAQEPTEFYR